MYRKSLSNLLGGSLLVASVAALNACGGEASMEGETPSTGTTGMPSTGSAGTPAGMGTAGKPAGTAGSAATAGKSGSAGSSSATPGGTAGMSSSAGTMAAAGGGAAGESGGAAGSGMDAAGSMAAAGSGGEAGGGAAGGAAPGGTLGGPLKYTGPFTMGMQIPLANMCSNTGPLFGSVMGGNKSPALAWSGGPADTKSFAVVLFDTTFMMLHWALWDIPATVNMLPEGLPAGFDLPSPMGAHQAATMGGQADNMYWGPCSAGSGAGTYEYRLYALKVDTLGLMESSTAMQAQTAIEGMMLEKVIWSGKPM